MANRYTKWNPTEFVQTYDPYPFEEMFKMGQYKQGRVDQASLVAGKLAGENAIESGYFTGDAAAQIMKEREADINKVTQIAASGNVAATNRAYAEALTRWQKNPMLQSIQSDVEQKKFVDAQLASKDYGISSLYTTHNPKTGQFTPTDAVKAKLARGEKISAHDYGLLSTEGSAAAFATVINPVKADLLQTYEYVADPNNPDGPQILKHKETSNDLDMNTFTEKAFPFVKSLSSNGLSLDQRGSADPVLNHHIEWRANEFAQQGKVFQLPDLLNDLELEAKKHLQFSNKKDATGTLEKDGNNSKENASGIFSGTSFSGSIVDAGITNKEIAEASNPIRKTTEATGMSIYSDVPIKNKYNDYNFSNISTGVIGSDKSPLSDVERQESQKFHSEQLQKTFDTLSNEAKANQSTYTLPNGTKRNINQVDEAQIMRDANNIIYNQRLAASTLNQTVEQAVRTGVPLPTFDKNGAVLIPDADKDKIREFMYNRGTQDPSKALQKGKRVGIGSKSYISNTDTEPIPMSERSSFYKMDPKYKNEIEVGAEEIEMYNALNPQSPIEGKFLKLFNDNLKTNFGKREFSVQEFSLFDTENSDFSGTEIPTYQKEITSRAADLAFRHSDRVSYNGRKLNCIDCEDGENGMTLKKLFKAGTEKDTGDFSGGKFRAKSYFYDHARDRIFARGVYEAQDENENTIKSKQYDINVDEIARHYMTGDHQYSLMINDAIQTSLNTIPKGTAGFVQSGDSNEVTEKFGRIGVTQDMDGNWSLESGKVFIEGKVVNMRDVLSDPEAYGIKEASRIDPDNMTYNQIIETVAGAYSLRDPLRESKNASGPPLSNNWESEFASQPSFNNLATSVGISDPDNLLKFTKGIMNIESGGGKVNKMGGSNNKYAGFFQLGDSAIKSAASELGVSAPSKYDIVNDTLAQANMFYGFTKSNYNTLTKGIPGFRGLPEKEKLAILAYAHQRGATGTVSDFKDLKRDDRGNLIKGDFKDAFGTPSSKYFDEIIQIID